MHAVVLEHVGQVVGLEQVVDAHHFDVRKILNSGAKHHAADAAETVDTYFDRHDLFPLMLILNFFKCSAK